MWNVLNSYRVRYAYTVYISTLLLRIILHDPH